MWPYIHENSGEIIANVNAIYVDIKHYFVYLNSEFKLNLEISLSAENNEIKNVIFTNENDENSIVVDDQKYFKLKPKCWIITQFLLNHENKNFNNFNECFNYIRSSCGYPNVKLIPVDIRQSSGGNKIRALVGIEPSAITYEETSPTIRIVVTESKDDIIKG